MRHRFLYDLLVITLALASGVLLLLFVLAYMSNFLVMAVEALLGSLFVGVCLFLLWRNKEGRIITSPVSAVPDDKVKIRNVSISAS